VTSTTTFTPRTHCGWPTRLIKAHKRFDFFVLPGIRHSYQAEADYFFWVRSDYFCRWLLGKAPDSVDIVELNREKEQTGEKRGRR
jgi:dipeptidyl-peptidase 4